MLVRGRDHPLQHAPRQKRERSAGELQAIDVVADGFENVLEISRPDHRVVGPADFSEAAPPRLAAARVDGNCGECTSAHGRILAVVSPRPTVRHVGRSGERAPDPRFAPVEAAPEVTGLEKIMRRGRGVVPWPIQGTRGAPGHLERSGAPRNNPRPSRHTGFAGLRCNNNNASA